MNDIDGIGEHARRMVAEAKTNLREYTIVEEADEYAAHLKKDRVGGYTIVEDLAREVRRLRAIESSREFICASCGHRKDSDASGVSNEF